MCIGIFIQLPWEQNFQTLLRMLYYNCLVNNYDERNHWQGEWHIPNMQPVLPFQEEGQEVKALWLVLQERKRFLKKAEGYRLD